MKHELVLSLATLVALSTVPGCQTGPGTKEYDGPPFAAVRLLFKS